MSVSSNKVRVVVGKKCLNSPASPIISPDLQAQRNARSADVEESSGGELSPLAGADSDNSEEYTFNIGAQGHETVKPIFQVRFMNKLIRIMVDSGTTMNILNNRD